MVCRSIIILTLISFSFAGYTKYGGELFADSQNARSAAMGGLHTSSSDGLIPALLLSANKPLIQFSHKSKFAGLANVSQATYIKSTMEYPLLFSLVNRNVDQIPDTRQVWIDESRSPESNDIDDYLNIGEISQNEFGLIISTAKEINKYLVGATLKPSFTDLGNSSSYGFSGDISILVKVSQISFFNIRAEDVLGLYKYWDNGTSEFTMPQITIAGWLDSSNILFGLESGFRLEQNPKLDYSLGFEQRKFKKIVFRCGHSNKNLFSFGLGFRLKAVGIDYAYISPPVGTPFDSSHLLSTKFYLEELNTLKGKLTP